jgi:hypothetical protein
MSCGRDDDFTRIFVRKPKGNILIGIDVGRKRIEYECVYWVSRVLDRTQWQFHVNTVIKLRVRIKGEKSAYLLSDYLLFKKNYFTFNIFEY